MDTRVTANIYAPDALKGRDDIDIVTPEQAGTLYGLFQARVQRTPDVVAYFQFESGRWHEYTWSAMSAMIDRWRDAFEETGLKKGDRIAVLLANSIHWVCFDQAAHAQGLVVVPLYMDDRADNMAYIMELTECRLLFIDSAQHWEELNREKSIDLVNLQYIVTLEDFTDSTDSRAIPLSSWLPKIADHRQAVALKADTLASIIFTSGTTGRPKGVMLSHANMLENAYACVRYGPFFASDLFVSFLPLSHTFERTVGYYLTIMAGCKVAYARSIPELADDILHHQPTVIVTVPRIFERVHQKILTQLDEDSAFKKKLFEWAVALGWEMFEYKQGRGRWTPGLLIWPLLDRLVGAKIRAKLGGRIRVAIAGGAPLTQIVGKTFNALGINVTQGYGMTESSPVLSTNLIDMNKPASIGLPLLGVSIKLGEHSEILAKGPNLMQGYWQNPKATQESFTQDGWLKTGDCGRIDEDGFIYITGRIKEILVLANGEKVPPADMESAIAQDALFEQSMVIGEGKPYLSALLVLNNELWQKQAQSLGVAGDDETVLSDPAVQEFLVKRIAKLIDDFPGYANIYKVHATLTPWTVENGLLTPTLKLKRPVLKKQFNAQIEKLYEGH